MPVETTDSEPLPPRFVVGIDLGTTNCAVAFVDTLDEESDFDVKTFPVTQWVDVGQFESRETLPSFHYELTESEQSAAAFQLPWQTADDQSIACVGAMARDAGLRHPGRRTASAKSWLSHDGVDRSADFLPWHGDPDVTRLSPVTASAQYLRHLREAWDHQHPDDLLADQDVVITLPASFDEVARALTVQAAKHAGLSRVFLIEEPQAAFYSWIQRQGAAWQDAVTSGQLILVCDIGGGTTDMTLIRVKPSGDDGDQVQFHRVAVGKHLILGGDNLDLAIAKLAEQKLIEQKTVTELTSDQWDRLISVARQVKEAMLDASRPETYTVSLPSQGARLVGGAVQVELTAAEIDSAVLDGFFPVVPLDATPEVGQSGFQEFGLPYASDPAITKHLAQFMTDHRRTGIDDGDDSAADRPDMILFNGGVLEAETLRDRIVDQLSGWFRKENENEWSPQTLASPRLDLAVAQGAAYYGLVRRGQGVRIAANLARTYYMQVGENPPQGMCLIPGSAQPGKRFRASATPLQLSVGAPVQFPLWSSSTRLADSVGQLVPIDVNEATPLPPICTALNVGRKSEESTLEVFVEAELSEIGTIGLYCVDANSPKRWKLEFDIRSTLETDRKAHEGGGEAAGIVDAATIGQCNALIESVFTESTDVKPSKLVKRLQSETGSSRNQWPPSLLRELWQTLLDHESGRRTSPAHEARWLNMAGFCLRPGYGVAVDDWRVSQTWRTIHGKLAHASPQSKTEALILWRRIAGGLSSGQQQQLAASLISQLKGRAGRVEPIDTIEIWRLLGSLERIAVIDKVDLGRLALSQLVKPKFAKISSALLWAIGRLGSRVPVYGPLNAVVRAFEAEDWTDLLLAIDAKDEATVSARRLALLQIARMTGDRSRDLSADARNRVAAELRKLGAPESQVGLMEKPGDLESEDQAAVFGDTLPLGICVQR